MQPDYLNMIKNSTLSRIGHATDLVWIIVGTISIHISSKMNVHMNNCLIADTSDLFYDYDGNPVKYVPKTTLFDKNVAFINTHPHDYQVIDLKIAENNMLCIHFSNGLVIQSLPEESANRQDEIWRILIKQSDLPHMVAYSKSVEWE